MFPLLAKLNIEILENGKNFKIYQKGEHTCEKSKHQPKALNTSNSQQFLEEGSKINILLDKEQLMEREIQMADQISKNPFLSYNYFLELDFNKNGNDFFLSASKIRKMITSIRGELFPKEPNLVFNGSIYKLKNLQKLIYFI